MNNRPPTCGRGHRGHCIPTVEHIFNEGTYDSGPRTWTIEVCIWEWAHRAALSELAAEGAELGRELYIAEWQPVDPRLRQRMNAAGV